MDSVTLLMGNQTSIKVNIIEPVSSDGLLLVEPSGNLTPEIEVAGLSAPDTSVIGNGLRQITREIIIQAFDSGDYVIPPVKYMVGNDTVFSDRLALRVMPVDVSEMETINPQADIENGESRWFDFLPDFIVDYWGWIMIVILLIAVATVLYLLLYKKTIKVPLRPAKPKPSPYEVAISELNSLKSRELCAQGLEKEYYTKLTDILRVYLQDRFGINAMEMTTGQINRAVYQNSETRPSEPLMKTILNMADFVKFAKARPLPEDNVRSFNSALKFVEETKPVPVTETQQSANQELNLNKK